MNMLRGLRPAYLRIGGTAADTVIFNETLIDNFTENCDCDNIALMESLSWNVFDNSCNRRSWPDLYLSRRLYFNFFELTFANCYF